MQGLNSVPVGTQHHAQSESGEYEYGYTNAAASKIESKSADGVTRGSYSYVDANGILQTVNYIADDLWGFRVVATNLPAAPGMRSLTPSISLDFFSMNDRCGLEPEQ